MALTQKTVVSSVTWQPNVSIGIRLEKQIVDDSGAVMASTTHRLAVASMDELDASLASVNAQIAGEGYPPLSAADVKAEIAKVGAQMAAV